MAGVSTDADLRQIQRWVGHGPYPQSITSPADH
jgi:hypothetical protein